METDRQQDRLDESRSHPLSHGRSGDPPTEKALGQPSPVRSRAGAQKPLGSLGFPPLGSRTLSSMMTGIEEGEEAV